MDKYGGDFVRHGVGINRDRNGAHHLRRGDRPVEPRPVGADDGDGLAGFKPEPDQALRDGARLLVDLAPTPGLPEAQILQAEGGARPAQGRVGAKSFAKVSSACGPSPPVAKPFLPWTAPISLPAKGLSSNGAAITTALHSY